MDPALSGQSEYGSNTKAKLHVRPSQAPRLRLRTQILACSNAIHAIIAQAGGHCPAPSMGVGLISLLRACCQII